MQQPMYVLHGGGPFLEKLVVIQVYKNFQGNWRFITVIT